MLRGEDEEISSWKVSYTVTDDLSVSYGEETHETNGQPLMKKLKQISASYTTGGMTVSLAQTEQLVLITQLRYSRKMETWSFICVLI